MLTTGGRSRDETRATRPQTSTVVAAQRSHDSTSVPRRTPASDIARHVSGSASRRSAATASRTGSSASTRKPVTPSSTIDGTPPVRVATTGSPDAVASVSVTPPAFARAGSSSTSCAAYRSAIPDRATRPRTRTSSESVPGAEGPAPTTVSSHAMPALRSPATISTARSPPFRAQSRPTNSSRSGSPGRGPPGGVADVVEGPNGATGHPPAVHPVVLHE